MRIVCPHCAAVYDVPDQALARPPRLLRCARCQHQWPPPPPPPEPVVAVASPRAAAPRIDAPPFTVIEIPPRPAAARQQLRLAIGPPLVDDSRLGRARPLGARTISSGLFGDRPLGIVAGIVGWALTAAVLCTVVGFVLLRQPQIEALWPPSQRLYGLLGLH